MAHRDYALIVIKLLGEMDGTVQKRNSPEDVH